MIDRRATSSTIGFVLALGIFTIVSVGLLTATLGIAENQQETVREQTATQINHETIQALQKVDSAEGGEATIDTFRNKNQFSITIENTSQPKYYKVIVEGGNVKTTQYVTLSTKIDNTPVTSSTGNSMITYNTSNNTIVIKDD
jgi:hypothetical protein